MSRRGRPGDRFDEPPPWHAPDDAPDDIRRIMERDTLDRGGGTPPTIRIGLRALWARLRGRREGRRS